MQKVKSYIAETKTTSESVQGIIQKRLKPHLSELKAEAMYIESAARNGQLRNRQIGDAANPLSDQQKNLLDKELTSFRKKVSALELHLSKLIGKNDTLNTRQNKNVR